MEQLVRVDRLMEDGTAEVILTRQSACSGDCHKCTGCGAVGQTMTMIAQNPIGAVPGERVILRGDAAPVLTGAVILYILPLILFFLGYALGTIWNLGAVFGGLAFLLGMAGAVIFDRRMSRKNKCVYTIIGYPQGNADRKEDRFD